MTTGDPGRPRRPARLTPGMMDYFASESLDPALIIQVADESAAALVRAGRASDDPQVTARLVAIVDEVGLSTIAELWAQRPARSLPGLLWRLYALREWVRRDPAGATADYQAGLAYADVAAVVAGAPHAPGPEELSALVDEILRGVFDGDLGVALHRAAAFSRVVCAGRAARDETDVRSEARAAPPARGAYRRPAADPLPEHSAEERSAGEPHAGSSSDPWPQQVRRAAALQATADDLEAGARAWQAGDLI